LLDEYGEALLIDLRKYFNIDLVAFLRGEVASSPRLILTFIRHLPEGSNYVAILQSAPVEELTTSTDEPSEIDPVQESQMWTQDRVLMAQLINSVNMLVRHSIQWQDGKAPNLPLIGPASWRGEGPAAKPSKPLTVMDVINNVMGLNNV
jgi:hypothetical protein